MGGDQAYRQWQAANRDALLAFHGLALPPTFVRRRRVALALVASAIGLMVAVPESAAFGVPTRVMLVCSTVAACAHWLAGSAGRAPIPILIAALLSILGYVEAVTAGSAAPTTLGGGWHRAIDLAGALIRYVLAAGFLTQAWLLYRVSALAAKRFAWSVARGRTIDL